MRNFPKDVAQTVKDLPTVWETQVRSLGWEDPLEKEMATHSSTLAWKIPWTEAIVHEVAKSQTRLSPSLSKDVQQQWAGTRQDCFLPRLSKSENDPGTSTISLDPLLPVPVSPVSPLILNKLNQNLNLHLGFLFKVLLKMNKETP